jgi:hypothetical protein
MATESQKGSFLRQPIPVSDQQHTLLTVAHTVVCLGVVSASALHQIPSVPSPQQLSSDKPPTAPTPQQAADYTQLLLSVSAPHQSQHNLFLVIAAYPPPKLLFSRKGAHAPLPSRVSASLRSIPLLSLRNGQALDCIHPTFNTSNYQVFLRKP